MCVNMNTCFYHSGTSEHCIYSNIADGKRERAITNVLQLLLKPNLAVVTALGGAASFSAILILQIFFCILIHLHLSCLIDPLSVLPLMLAPEITTERESVAKVVTRIFESKGEAVRMLSAIAAKEIDATGELNFFLLLRRSPFFNSHLVITHGLTAIQPMRTCSSEVTRSQPRLSITT